MNLDQIPAWDTPQPRGAKSSLICWLFWHKWQPAHRIGKDENGKKVWIYTHHVCNRCHQAQWRLMAIQPEEIDSLEVAPITIIARKRPLRIVR